MFNDCSCPYHYLSRDPKDLLTSACFVAISIDLKVDYSRVLFVSLYIPLKVNFMSCPSRYIGVFLTETSTILQSGGLLQNWDEDFHKVWHGKIECNKRRPDQYPQTDAVHYTKCALQQKKPGSGVPLGVHIRLSAILYNAFYLSKFPFLEFFGLLRIWDD